MSFIFVLNSQSTNLSGRDFPAPNIYERKMRDPPWVETHSLSASILHQKSKNTAGKRAEKHFPVICSAFYSKDPVPTNQPLQQSGSIFLICA